VEATNAIQAWSGKKLLEGAKRVRLIACCLRVAIACVAKKSLIEAER